MDQDQDEKQMKGIEDHEKQLVETNELIKKNLITIKIQLMT